MELMAQKIAGIFVQFVYFLCLRTEGAGGIMFPGCPSVRPSGFFRLRDNSMEFHETWSEGQVGCDN